MPHTNRSPQSSPEPSDTKVQEEEPEGEVQPVGDAPDPARGPHGLDHSGEQSESPPPADEPFHAQPAAGEVSSEGPQTRSKDGVEELNQDSRVYISSVKQKEPQRNLLVAPKIKAMYNKNHLPTDIREDEYYYEWVEEILEGFPNKGPPYTPGRLNNHVYIGSLVNAEDEKLLKRMGITHVLNCAGTRRFDLEKSPYPKDVGVKEYRMIPAEDFEDYDIVQHFSTAFAFIDRCKNKGGKCLIHCNLGVNRSGAVCAGYLMMSEGKSLLQIIEHIKGVRSVVLTNRGFRYQLINYARLRNLLDPIIVENGLPATIPPPLGNSKFARIASNEAKSRKHKGTSDVPPATDFLNINGIKSSSCYYSDPRTGGHERGGRTRDELPPRPSSACGMVDAPVSSRSFTRSSSAMGVTNRWSSSSWSDMDIDEYLDDVAADSPYRFLRQKRPPSSAYNRPSSALGISNSHSYSSSSSSSPSASPRLTNLFRHKPVYSNTSSLGPSFNISNAESSLDKPRNILNILSKSRAGASSSSNGYNGTSAYHTLTIPSNGGFSYTLPKPPFGTSRRRFGPSKNYSSANY